MHVSSFNLNNAVLELIKKAQSRDPFCQSLLTDQLKDAEKQRVDLVDDVVLKAG